MTNSPAPASSRSSRMWGALTGPDKRSLAGMFGFIVLLHVIGSGPLAAIAAIPLDYAGYGIVLLFLVAWLVALAVWRSGRIEEKWSSGLRPDGSGPSRETDGRRRPGRRRRGRTSQSRMIDT